MPGALDILQIKMQDVLNSLQPQAAPNLTSKWKSPTKGKIIPLSHKSRKPGRNLLLVAHAIENLADVSIIPSRNYSQRVVLVCCCHQSHSYCSHFIPGTFSNQVAAVFQEPRLPVIIDPRANQHSLTEAACLPMYHHSVEHRFLCNAWSWPFPCKRRARSACDEVPLAGSSAHVLYQILCLLGQVMLNLYFCRDLECKRKSKPLLKRL